MKPAPFAYHRPTTVADVVDMLGRLPNARVLAGGQSLVPMLNLRAAMVDHLIDLRGVTSLAGIEERADSIAIGAMTTQRSVEHSSLMREFCPLLAEAIDHVGHQQTRNWGTVGGSLCHLDPGAELPVAAAALEAELSIAGPEGERILPFSEFPVAYLTTSLEAEEILTRIVVPKLPAGGGWAFVEFNQRPADFAVVSVAVALRLDDDGFCQDLRIALGGIDQVPVRLFDAEQEMAGRVIDAEALAFLAESARALPYEGDAVYPSDFRRRIAPVLVQRAMRKASARAEQHR